MKKFNILMKFMQTIILTFMFIMLFIEHNIMKWMLMEAFSLIFIGFFMNYSSKSKSGSLFYFYISSIMSLFLFYSLMTYYDNWTWEWWNEIDHEKIITKKIIQYTIIMKLGVYPFQFWMPFIYTFLEWNTIFLFSTINKLFPIYILTTLSAFDDPVFMYFLFLNSLMAPILCIDEQNYKKILAYSSISHSTFLILLSYLNTYMSFFYYILYTLNSLIFITLMEKMNITTKSKLNSNYTMNSKLIKFLFITFTLSYSMLPPLMFFTIKWLFFYETIMSNSTNFFLWSIMIFSVMMTYNYLDMIKFTIFHKKLMKKYILLNKYLIKNDSKYKMSLILINLFIFTMFFY